MCGVAGFYSSTQEFTRESLTAMTEILKHRGPDAEGYFFDGTCGLGHRRLSIIDLSERANQPMYSADGRYVIAYNGEVYNFNEIGAKLGMGSHDKKGMKFRSSSDTEVILEAFAAYGTNFVHELNGMFAFAIYDTLNKELYLYRDRMGIKSLYFYWDGKNFAFASELKALRLLENIEFSVNKDAIHDFLHLGYIPAPHSIYNNIYKLKSGSYLKLSQTNLEIRRYWNVYNKISSHVVTHTDQALVQLSDLLISSVQYQLKSDVPFGVFLSGGIDSSLVTAQASMLSSLKVNTFSIGFEENSHNESEYAKAVAKYLGTSHHEFIVSYKDAINLISDITGTYDEPFSDSSCIPTMLVSKLASEYVTVTLSGEGGDELFFGYGAYKWANYLNHNLVKILRKPTAYIFNRMSSRYQRIARMLDYEAGTDLKGHVFSQEQYLFADHEIPALLTYDYIRTNSGNSQNRFVSVLRMLEDRNSSGEIGVNERKLSVVEMQALYDLEKYLQDDLLTKVDRASMKYSIETRVPYLDHRMVEFAINLSPDLKYRHGIYKYILKKVLYQYVPKKLFDRPKQGFAIPLNKWLHTSLRYLLDDFLSKESIEKFGILNFEEVDRLKKEFLGGKDFLYNRLWLLIVLQMWLESQKNITR